MNYLFDIIANLLVPLFVILTIISVGNAIGRWIKRKAG